MFSGWNKIRLIREVFTRCTEEFINIVCIGVSTLPPPQKHPLPLSCQAPVKSANCPSRLKVTKFSVKISQFEFLVMPERNIFVYKLFLLLNISDFSLFLCKSYNLPGKKSLPHSQQFPSKNWDPVKTPFLKTWLEAQPPVAERGLQTITK